MLVGGGVGWGWCVGVGVGKWGLGSDGCKMVVLKEGWSYGLLCG